ncbi:MAG: PcfJ domain-containing protein [Hyphomicrobiaceae bacterium]
MRDVRLADFHDDYREPVRELSSMSLRMEELAESFPALLFALATGYGDPEKRAKVFDMIIEGAPLKNVAATFGLPIWLRKLPPQAFSDPIRNVPDGDGFARRIANFVPKSPLNSAAWFSRVCDAYAFAGADYMLWMARHKRFPFGSDGQDALMLMGAWAWASLHPGSDAHNLLRMPWMPDISLKRAYDEARAWERRVDLAITLGAGTQDTWFAGDTVNGFEFVPITTVEEFLAEARAMGNCLDQYADPINNTHVRVFSIRKDSEPIANIEIAPHDDDCLMPGIEQLRGPRNNRAAPEIWQAAYSWLGQQTFRVFPGPSHGGRTEVADAWQHIWGPILADIDDTQLRKKVRSFARQAHGCAGVQRESARVNLDL